MRPEAEDLSGFPEASAGCPQCGAEVELGVGDPVLRCAFCRTGLYVRPRDFLGYHWPWEGAAPPGLVWVPYWRFRGLWYRLFASGARGSLLDGTGPGRAGLREGSHLGVRPQAVRFRLGPPVKGRVVWPDRAVAQVVDEAETQAEAAGGEAAPLRRFVGEVTAVLWVPFALERRGGGWALLPLFPDGPGGALAGGEALALRRALDEPPRPWAPRFLPLRCPECAADLPAVPHAVGFWCGRCGRGWVPGRRRLEPLAFRVRVSHGSGVRYLPVWELEIGARGLSFRSQADMVRWAVPYWTPNPGDDRTPPLVRIPAFKLHPRLFLRAARNLTLGSVAGGDATRLPAGPAEAEAVRLPLSEAAQALKPVLAELAGSQRGKAASVLSARLRVRAARLVLLPFARRGAEWVEETSGVAVPAAALERGRGL
ncbi:TFIIB-type zinc ribbon-containing protein [Deferrisoma sp.]